MPALEIMNGEAVGIIDTATVRCIHAVRFTTLQVGMPTRGERQDPYPTEKPFILLFSPWRARAGKTYVIHKDVGCATDAQGNQLDHRFLGRDSGRCWWIPRYGNHHHRGQDGFWVRVDTRRCWVGPAQQFVDPS